MANLLVKDGAGVSKYLSTSGAGSDGDPHIPAHSIDQATPGTTDSVTVKASMGIGSLTETAPTTDTASSGLNGRLQRIAQRLTSLIALLPAALGQTTMAASLPVAIASNQSAVSTTDNGPAQTTVQTYTASADMTTAASITAAPTSGLKIVALDILVSTDTAMNFSIQEETSATVFAKAFLPANGVWPVTLRGYLKAAVADKKLMGKASVAGNVAITAIYTSA